MWVYQGERCEGERCEGRIWGLKTLAQSERRWENKGGDLHRTGGEEQDGREKPAGGARFWESR
jgi:hypothetical protein